MTVSQAPDTAASTRRITYEPGLDGLRAVALLAIFVVHANLGLAPGGFLAVSTFFTLSGFLITALLVSEHRSKGRVALGLFWQRRARRLLPASLLAVACIAAATLVFGDATQVQKLFGDTVGTLAYVANWRFLLAGTTYAGEFSGQSPLLHFWSLAIEEQFYLLFPLVMVGALAASARWRRAVPGVLLGGIALSLVAGIVASGAETTPDKLYFRTDIRAGELLVGALFGYWWAGAGRHMGEWAHQAIRWSGGGLILLMLGLIWTSDYHDTFWYRGGLLAYSLVTVGVILAAVETHGPVKRALSWKPLVWIGVVSYGAYLVHWPLFMWLYTNTDVPGWVRLVGGTAVALMLAQVSYQVVELPVREKRTFSLRWLVVLGIVLVAAALLIALIAPKVARNQEVPAYLQPMDPSGVEVIESSTTTIPATTTTTASTRPSRILLLGDSVAASLNTALGAALNRQGAAFANSASGGCGVLEGHPADTNGQPFEITLACSDGILALQRSSVDRVRPDLVVVFSSWENRDRVLDGQWAPYGTAASDARMLDLYQQMVDRLTLHGARVALLTIPDPVDSRSGPADNEMLRRIRHLNDLLAEVARRDSTRVTLVRVDDIVCPADPCPAEVDGVALRPRDGTHFDNPAAAKLVADRLAERVMQVQPGTR